MEKRHTHYGTCDLCEGVCHVPHPTNHYDESRPLSNGMIKNTFTGEVREPVTTTISEIENDY